MKTAVPCYYHLDVEVSPERVGQVRRILAARMTGVQAETSRASGVFAVRTGVI